MDERQTVWVVTASKVDSPECSTVVGVFSSEQAASEFCQSRADDPRLVCQAVPWTVDGQGIVPRQ